MSTTQYYIEDNLTIMCLLSSQIVIIAIVQPSTQLLELMVAFLQAAAHKLLMTMTVGFLQVQAGFFPPSSV